MPWDDFGHAFAAACLDIDLFRCLVKALIPKRPKAAAATVPAFGDGRGA